MKKVDINILVILVDIVLLLVSLAGIAALPGYYVPWMAISADGDNVFVRSGPDKDYAPVRKLSGDEPVLIVGELYDWYVLSRDTLEMVRQDTLKPYARTSKDMHDSKVKYILENPPWHLIAIVLLWFWPRLRSMLWQKNILQLD